MRRVTTATGLLLLAAGLSGSAAQESPMTLEAARAAARRTSPRLAAARNTLEAAAGLVRQAGSYPNPLLTWNREQTSRGSSVSTQDIAALEQPLDVWSRSARVEAARRRREAAEARLDAVLGDLDIETTRAWAEAIAADRRATLADTAAAQFREAARVIDERLAAGDVSGFEARRLKLEGARYLALSARAHGEQRQARLRLAALTGLPADALLPALDAVLPVTPLPGISPDSAARLALAVAPELRAALLDARAAEASARETRERRIPEPVLSAGYKSERPAGAGGSAGFVAGISFSLPLWDRSGGAVDAADADARGATALATGTWLGIERDARSAFDAALRADAQLASLAAQLGPESAAALLAARTAYAEGEISLLEFLDTVRAYREAEAMFADAAAESIIQRAELERRLGLTLLR